MQRDMYSKFVQLASASLGPSGLFCISFSVKVNKKDSSKKDQIIDSIPITHNHMISFTLPFHSQGYKFYYEHEFFQQQPVILCKRTMSWV